MGKDREGKFHPKKGKPSGSGKEEGVGVESPYTGSHEQYREMADKYTEGADETPEEFRMRHPNRNVNKNEARREDRRSDRRSNKSRNETFTEERSTASPEELPGILTREIFQNLAEYRSEVCISLYMPTHKAGVQVNEMQDNINFKSSLQQVANTLKGNGVDNLKIQQILEPGYELLRNDSFWRYLSNGLAVFMADGFFKYVKMPDTPPNELLVNNSFLLKPLVNAMTIKEYFYLLTVSKKSAKLYRADAFGMQEIQIPELPNGIDDVVHLEEKVDHKLFRTESRQNGTGASFHGHGAGKPDEKENIALYLEEVDDTLWDEVLHNENAPLLLAGVEYLLPIYKSVTDYGHVWDEVITGNQENEDLNALYEKARKVMEPHFRQRTRKALENYGNQSATALTSDSPADIIPAAHYGRIWHLFLIRGTHIWGTFDEMENVLDIHAEKQEGDECLIDKAVIRTILNGGDVHFVSREDMPSGGDIAALMRY